MDLNRRTSGVLLHLTSLPGPHGVGDLGPQAYRFVDWLAEAGQRIWQWLPTTPVGPGDSPYQSVSAFAGSPLMVALEPLVERGWLAAAALPAEGFDDSKVGFARVAPWRLAQLRLAHAGFVARAAASDRKAFGAWCAAEARWLDDYSLFMALQTVHGGRSWWDWAPALARRDKSALAEARSQYADEIMFWHFVQWCFDTQCTALKQYANARDVALMGDLPIFVAHHSADCWARPDLYLLDENFQTAVVAGVPPDDLGPLGQRWGNPLYRWDRMADEGFAWWIARVARALTQADLFRIDHFRGFCGYYEIPASSPDARQGRWVKGPGKALFDALQAALGTLPIVAEDLGFITDDVRDLRDSLGLPGMKILQFAFGGDGAHEFLPHNYPRNVVVYTGTHDNDTARGWWTHAPSTQQQFAASYLGCDGSDVHWAMIRGALNSVANTAITPMQDLLGLDSAQRMNTPGTLGPENWVWRFGWDAVTAELTGRLARLSAGSGRGPFGPLGSAPAPTLPVAGYLED